MSGSYGSSGHLATLGAASEGRLRGNRPVKKSLLPAHYEALLAKASVVGDWLGKQAIQGAEGVSWLGLSTSGKDQWQLAPLSTDLYDGLPGVAFFLAHLGELTGKKCYEQLARAAVRSLSAQLERNEICSLTGGFSGLGGVIYVFAHLSRLWADASLMSQAAAFARLIPDLVKHDTQFDVIGGAAGCILSLNSVHALSPSETTLNAMLACGNRLTDTAQKQGEGIGWFPANLPSRPLTGFAHGNAGIAYALLQAADVTGAKHSGIGYGLLRLADPVRVPSVLALAPPCLS